jgi:glycosyltransferase involved in cell wall biosynthesis
MSAYSPKVSVILTSYNHSKYLREAIESVLNQTFKDYELIIWDDASTDDSWTIIQSYSDSRIKSFRNNVQRRGVYGINKAISEVALGEFIAIHHSDDVWELDKLDKQVAYIDADYKIGAVFTWVKIIDDNGIEQEDEWFSQKNMTRWQLLNNLFFMRNYLAHPSALIRKQCYEQSGLYRFGLAQSADAEMWSRLLLTTNVHVIEEKLTKHRLFRNKSNTSGKRPDSIIRLDNEWNTLRTNFLSISSFDDLVGIFPSLEFYRRSHGFNAKFLLAIVCISDKDNRSACQLGLTWLFDLFKDLSVASQITDLYSFTYIDLINLTGELDPYAVFAVTERDRALSVRDAAVTERDDALSELHMVYRSKSWRITALLRFFMSLGK